MSFSGMSEADANSFASAFMVGVGTVCMKIWLSSWANVKTLTIGRRAAVEENVRRLPRLTNGHAVNQYADYLMTKIDDLLPWNFNVG